MTLIVGINLSDKIYFAGDTRITFNDGTYKENIIKIVPIYPLNPQQEEGLIVMGVAGDLEFAQFLYRKIIDRIKSGELSGDIRQLYKEIDFLSNEVDYWLTQLKKSSDKKCALLFGGISFKRKKSVKRGKAKDMTNLFKEKNTLTEMEIIDLQKVLSRDHQKNISIERLIELNQPGLKKSVTEAYDSFIFGVKINPTEFQFEKEHAEWGEELIAYGYNVKKDDIPKELVFGLELLNMPDGEAKNSMEEAIIRDTVQSFSITKGIKEIGDVITTIGIDENGLALFTYNQPENIQSRLSKVRVYTKGGGAFFEKNNQRAEKLIPFFAYEQESEITARL